MLLSDIRKKGDGFLKKGRTNVVGIVATALFY